MPVVTSGLYEVRLFQSALGQEILNVFHYVENLGADDRAGEIAARFNVQVMPKIAAIQSTGISYTNLQVVPIFGGGLEVNEPPAVSAGSLAGVRTPSFVAASVRLFRSTKETRSGWKRFSGVTEEVMNTASFTAPYLADLQTLATELATELDLFLTNAIPVIVRRPFSTKAQSPDWVANAVASASAIDRPTTQNSRK